MSSSRSDQPPPDPSFTDRQAPQPPIPNRLPSKSYSTYGSQSQQPASEFGAGYAGGSSSTSARRPLPQPGPPPFPTSSSSSSMNSRRALPSLPQNLPPAPPPPPRPYGRALPSLPPIQSGIAAEPPARYSTPPPQSRPLPAPTSPSLPPPPRQPSSNVGRNPSDRVARESAVYDSPTSIIDSYAQSSDWSSNLPSRNPSSSTHATNYTTRTSNSSDAAPVISDTPATSISRHSGYEEWYAHIDKLDRDEEGGTNVTLRPPSIAVPKSPESVGNDFGDGRRTPTAGHWQREPPNLGHLHIEPRIRTVSSSTIGAIDANLPSTPTFAPQPTIQHQRSFMRHANDGSVDFPVPHLTLPGTDPTSSRNSSTSNLSSVLDASTGRHGSHTSFPEARMHAAPERQASETSSLRPSIASDRRIASELSTTWREQSQQPASWVETKLRIHRSRADALYDGDDDEVDGGPSRFDEGLDEYDEEDPEVEEVDEIRFFQPSFLSEAALQLRDRVERRRQTKAGIAWVGSFTGRDIVNTIQSFLPPYTCEIPGDRRAALVMAQSLQNQLWFVEVDWDIKPLRDSSEDVFRFMGEMEGMGGGEGLSAELPAGVMTMATKCYSPSCTGDARCYAPRCPHKILPGTFLGLHEDIIPVSQPTPERKADWREETDPFVLHNLSPTQITRQNILRNAIDSEIQYEADLAAMETFFIDGLRMADPPVIHPHRLEHFISEVFSNERQLHQACKGLIEHFSIRERESPMRPIISSVGDIFLEAAADFRTMYPEYTGNLPHAETVLKKELDDNPEFRFFCERVVRENDRRRDIKYLITRPSTQLQRYPAVLEALLNVAEEDDPDRDFLAEALSSIQNLSAMSQLKLFHASKGRGPAGKIEWHSLVPQQVRDGIDKKEQKRQMQIWELIKGEMEYVADLEVIDTLFVDGLRIAEKGIVIERTRLEIFVDDAFHNYRSLLEVHQNLLENLQARQMEQHPQFGMISDLILDAALNWRDAYMEYVTHYPIAKAKVQEEETRNPKFATFLKECLRDPVSNRQDIYHFINRPIPRLLRYNLLLSDILDSLKKSGVPDDHPDIETIPQVMELIGDLAKSTQRGVAVNDAKVELWQLSKHLEGGRFGPRSVKDLDLLNPSRELIYRTKVFRQPEGTIGGSWTELTALLFDNYLVLVKPEKQTRSSRREERQMKYFINRRPIPLELLSLGSFGDGPRPKSKTKLLSVGQSHEPEGSSDAAETSKIWPFTISFIGQGQLGGQYTLFAESYAIRQDWKEKLTHAKVLRSSVNEATKVFEMTPVSLDTFYMAPNYAAPNKDGETPYTGRATCSVPFTTVDRRQLIAVGCDEGVWIGLRSDPRSLRKVLHVKLVTNIAVLEEFGIFLVLQDRSLLAYHLEALVPSANSPQVRAAPQRLSPGKDIVFFTVGQLSGRTLVLYMKKKGMDSLFRVLEPILGRNTEDQNRQRRPFGNLLGQRSEWFRLYKDFFIPTEALGVHLLKHKLAVVCSKGFEIMDLTDLKGALIPIFDPNKIRDKPRLAEIQRRCESSKPLGMFRSTETEFLLCYDSFGIYVDRHGEPNRDCQAIEWEGRPDSVAFHPPYLLLVSAPFIEIRHIDNAKLLQIYTGSDIRLTWDGTGGQARPPVDNPGPNGYGDEVQSQEPRIHICQRPEDPKKGRGGNQGIGQHVFELEPTLALNNPLLNPVHTHDANYFPPAPMISHRASSVMTTSTSDGYFANAAMTPNASNGGPAYQNGFPAPARSSRSEVSFDSGGGWNGYQPSPPPPQQPTASTQQQYPQAQAYGQGDAYARQSYGQQQTQGYSQQETQQAYAQYQQQAPQQQSARQEAYAAQASQVPYNATQNHQQWHQQQQQFHGQSQGQAGQAGQGRGYR